MEWSDFMWNNFSNNNSKKIYQDMNKLFLNLLFIAFVLLSGCNKNDEPKEKSL